MAKDLANLAPTKRGQDYGAPAPDPVQVALTWRVALERKATDTDLLDEPVPFRNQIIQGALSWLQSYEGDFDYLLDLRSRLNPRYGLSPRQACGVLNCMAAEARRNAPKPGGPAQTREEAGAQTRAQDPSLTRPVPQAPQRIAVEDEGVYVLPDGTVCKVQATKDKARTYAKRWTPVKHLDRLMETGAHEHGEYVYEQGLVQRVAAEGRKMTLAEAKAHSVRYGRCVRCGRQLTDGKSVEAGMGPVCLKWFEGR